MTSEKEGKEELVNIMTTASAFAMPRPVENVHDTHALIWEEMSHESLQKMLGTFMDEGSVIKDDMTHQYRINFRVIEQGSELAKAMQAFIDVFAPAAYHAEMEFRERIEIPTTENRILVLDDLEETLKARNIV